VGGLYEPSRNLRIMSQVAEYQEAEKEYEGTLEQYRDALREEMRASREPSLLNHTLISFTSKYVNHVGGTGSANRRTSFSQPEFHRTNVRLNEKNRQQQHEDVGVETAES